MKSIRISGFDVAVKEGNMPGVRILGYGAYVPEQIVDNAMMTAMINADASKASAEGIITGDVGRLLCSEDFIESRTGICERRVASAGQATSDLAAAAIQVCCEPGSYVPGRGNFLRLATVTPDHPASPPTAAIIQHKMGWAAEDEAGLVDRMVGDGAAACTSFVTELCVAESLVRSGNFAGGFVVGADVMSRLADPCDRAIRIILGDGAFALRLGYCGPLDDDCFLPDGRSFFFGADGSMADLIVVPAGGSRLAVTHASVVGAVPRLAYLHMQGNEVFKRIVRRVVEVVEQALAKAQLSMADIDLFFFHQANLRMIDAVTDRLGIAHKTHNNIDRFGNTTSASIGLCIAEAHARGVLRAGMRTMLIAFGGGFTWGTCILDWPEVPICHFA